MITGSNRSQSNVHVKSRKDCTGRKMYRAVHFMAAKIVLPGPVADIGVHIDEMRLCLLWL